MKSKLYPSIQSWIHMTFFLNDTKSLVLAFWVVISASVAFTFTAFFFCLPQNKDEHVYNC